MFSDNHKINLQSKSSGECICSGNPQDITIAFNRGAGGAVEGQLAESYLLTHDQRNMLLSPARELTFTSLPASGGVVKKKTTLNQPILSTTNLAQIRQLAQEVREKIGHRSTEPFDVEFGFKEDKIWLFQIRPYVESRRTLSSVYLHARDSATQTRKMIVLDAAYYD